MGANKSQDSVRKGPRDITLMLSYPAATGFKVTRKFALPCDVVCSGGRRSKVLQGIVDSQYDASAEDNTICIQVEITQEQSRAFPSFIKFIKGESGDASADSDKAMLVQLAHKFGVDASDLEKESDTKDDSSVIATKENSDSSEASVSSFGELPNLLYLIEHKGNGVEPKKAQASISNLLTDPGLDLAEIAKTGAISTLLQILSDEKFQVFHLDAAALIQKMLKLSNEYSETLAQRMLSYLAIETFITSQLVHSHDIRRHTLSSIGHMAQRSEALCRAILAKNGCLECILRAYSIDNLKSSAAYPIRVFCSKIPREMLYQQVLDKFPEGMYGTNYVVEYTCRSFTDLVKAMTQADINSYSVETPLKMLFVYKSTHSFRAFLAMSHMPFILDSLCKIGLPFKKLSSIVSCGDDREIQLLACNIIAVLVRYMRIKRKPSKEYSAHQKEIFSVLSKLLSYDGKTKIPAAKACAEVLRYSDSEKLDVTPGPIAAICNVMSDCMAKNEDMLLFVSIFMGLQRLLASESACRRHDFSALIGVKIAETMVMRPVTN